MKPISKQPIREFNGRILGYVETDKDGNQQIRDFYGTILGFYDKKRDVTTDFYGRIVTKGNTAIGFLYNNKK